ncbi:MAG: glycoside hydrolase family 6 protein [Nocardioides sp.]|nr:glycoside hydrolase family 6 protein [Nocardioides sp.]
MLRSRSRAPRGSRLVLAVLSLLVLLPGCLAFLPVFANATERPTAPTARRTPADENPLANRPWGVYSGNAEMAWAPYAGATGPERDQLARIALAPKAKWFGDWIPDAEIGTKVQEYIASSLASTGNDPETLVQMTIFRMQPWEHAACSRLPTAAESASYQTWIDRFVAAVGQTHVAIMMQPDGPFALCAPRKSTAYSEQLAIAVAKLESLPNASVYLEAGAADWHRMKPAPAVQLLVDAGVAQARGFVLNVTHYDSTKRQIRYGAKVVAELEKLGITGKRFVVDTASNGRAFTGEKWRKAGKPGGRFDNAAACTSPAQASCVTLGIPPTWRTDDPRWGLPAARRQEAAQLVDAFVWAGRPWLRNATAPFDRARALAMVATSPYAAVPFG